VLVPATGPISRHGLLAAGYSDAEVRAQLRAGRLLAVRPGRYLPGDARPDGPEAWHAATARAAIADLAPGTVASHASAAVLHGLPVWGLPLDRVQATRARRSGARRTTAVDLHAAAIDPDEITVVGGVLVTAVPRTVVDIARSAPLEQAVAVADAALFAGRTTRAALEESLLRAHGRPGRPAARRAVAFADGRAESVGESRSRVAMRRAGIPAPVLQQPFVTRDGRDLGRVDFWWRDRRVVGEFDGRVKYGRLLRPGQSAGDAVVAEKRREDLIRAEDTRFVRWGWTDLAPFDAVAGRLRHALGID
jgi:hypothetical protein